METVAATCPSCHATHEYASSFVGRYTHCLGCKTRFYVEVPKLGASPTTGPTITITAKPDTTLDDLLRNSQQSTRYIIESVQRLEANTRSLRWLIVILLLLGSANLAGLVYLLLTR